MPKKLYVRRFLDDTNAQLSDVFMTYNSEDHSVYFGPRYIEGPNRCLLKAKVCRGTPWEQKEQSLFAGYMKNVIADCFANYFKTHQSCTAYYDDKFYLTSVVEGVIVIDASFEMWNFDRFAIFTILMRDPY